MKKYLLLFTSAALLLVGCAKEQIVDLQEGELTNVTFTANLDNGVATKAVADGDGKGPNVNRCIMEIYYGDTFYKRLVQPVTPAAGEAKAYATFANVPVVAGKEYTVLFWADCGGDNNADKYYTTKTDTNNKGLKAVTVAKDAFIGALKAGENDELDAFYLGDKYTITQGGVSKDVTLKRPFAQLNVITTDVAANKAVISEGLLPDKVAVKYKASNEINVATGEVSGEGDYEYEASVYGKYENDNWNAVKTRGELTLSMDYVLAAADKGAIDVEFKIKNGGDYVLTHNLTNLPYQRNYRTNVKGELLTVGGTWTATIDADWTTPNHDVPFYVASSIDDAQNYINSTNQEKSKAVDLTKAEIEQSDVKVDGTIHFVLKTTSPQDLVNFTLPAIPQGITATGWTIEYEDNYPTKNVGVNAPEGTKVTIKAPTSHVTVTGTSYAEIVASTGDNTLVIPQGVTVADLKIEKGGLEIHGIVAAASVTGTKETVFVRACEGLSETVYNTLKNYIALNYKAVQNSDNSWDIVPEDFWPNFAAADFSAIDQSAKTLSISTPAELALLAKTLNNGGSFAEYTISISGNLDMSEHFWKPIKAYGCGNLSNATIQGPGVIKNLKVKTACNPAASAGANSYGAGFIGLFDGRITFKDLTFENADVNVPDGSQVAIVVGLSYSTVMFDNVKIIGSTVYGNTKTGLLLGSTGGDGITATIKDCDIENSISKAEYSYALMVGLVNTSDHVVFEGNNTATNSHAVLDENVAATDMPDRKTIKGYEYGVDETKLWVVGVQDAWAECRSNPTPKKTIDGVEYSVMGDKFYHADGVVVDVCASDPVAKIGDTKYATLDAAFAAVQAGQTIEIIQTGTYTLPSPISNLTIKGIEGVEFNAMKEYGQSVSLLHDVNFESVKFIFGSNNYTGFQHSESVSFTKCIFDGKFNSYGTMLFEQCTFNSPEGDYSMWCYAGDVTYRNCTINCKGKFVNAYNESNALTDGDGNRVPWKVVAEGCTFNSSVKNKAAFNIKATCGATPLYYDVVIKNCTANGENWPAVSSSETLVVGSALWQVDDIKASVASKIKVTVDDTVVYTSPAIQQAD